MGVGKVFLFAILVLGFVTPGAAESSRPDENFMLVLRETENARKQKFGFKASGSARVTLQSGETVTLSNAWFDLIGDMHVRFVVDGEHSLRNVTSAEFAAYGLSPTAAAAVAIANIKARYGSPRATHLANGVMLVAGKSPDIDSSYFLDQDFWDGLLAKHPQGLVVGVPKRGGLIYAPDYNNSAVAFLVNNIRSLFETSEAMRVSSALYLYKDGTWTIYRSPAD